MLVSTYQHDYIPPNTKRYDFITRPEQRKKEEEVCQCIQPANVEIPKAALEQCSGVEWTGIAPMGKLIDPRIIPTKFSPDQIQGIEQGNIEDCFQMQPNRFLKILRTAYPDLYERLKEMPKDELSRRLDRQRLFTTYQIDFCGVNEYPEGIYESLKENDPHNTIDTKLLQKQGPCESFRTNVMQAMQRAKMDGYAEGKDPCEKAYKPFKIAFGDSNRFINSGNNSHWKCTSFNKKANFSEYMDTINKSGCIIMKNNLHDHSRCNKGKHCKHQIIFACNNVKDFKV